MGMIKKIAESMDRNLFNYAHDAIENKFRMDFEEYLCTRIGQRAKKFDAENPEFYKLFTKYALQIQSRGHKKFSAYAIFERIRWHTAIETTDPDFKLNNSYRPYYARKLMAFDVRFWDFFNVRGARN